MVDEDHLKDFVCRRLDWESFIDGVDKTAQSVTVDDTVVSRVNDPDFIPLRGGAKMRAKTTSKRVATKNISTKKYKMIRRKTPTKNKGNKKKDSSSDEKSGSDNSTMSVDITEQDNDPVTSPGKKAEKGKKKAGKKKAKNEASSDDVSEDEGKGKKEKSDDSQCSDDGSGSEGSGDGTDDSGAESEASSSSEGSDISHISGYSIPDEIPASVTHKQVKGKKPTWDAFEPSAWKQFYLWNSPFIKLLDAIAYDRTSLSDYLNKVIPSRDVKPKIDALSRTNKYWAVENALGRTLEHLGEHLGLPNYGVPVNATGKKGKDRAIYKQAKQELAEKHENALGDMIFLRERFWSEPSIFWNLPPIYIFGLLAHIGQIGGPKNSAACTDYVRDLFEDLITDGFRLPTEFIEHFMLFTQHDTMEHDMDTIYEHVTRKLAEGFTGEPGMASTQSRTKAKKAGESAQMRAYRLTQDGNKAKYEKDVGDLRGFILSNDGHNLLHEFPIVGLGYIIIVLYERILMDNSYGPLEQKFTTMMAELDFTVTTALSLTENDSDNGMNSLYGHGTEQLVHVRPWETIYQHNLFLRQAEDLLHNIREMFVRDEDETEEEYARSTFENFVNGFLYGSLMTEKLFYREELAFRFPIVHLPFRRHIREDIVGREKKSPKQRPRARASHGPKKNPESGKKRKASQTPGTKSKRGRPSKK